MMQPKDRMLLFLRTAVLFLLTLSAGDLPLCAQAAEHLLSPAQAVAAILQHSGIHAEAAQIEVPPVAFRGERDPQLRLTAAELLPDGRIRLRFVCQQIQACVPFLATVRSASSQDALRDLAGLRDTLAVLAPSRPQAAAPERVLAGQHATLLLEDQRMRITLPVLVIDTGNAGAVVRVSSLDRKQTFSGVVLDAGTVRSSLR